MSDKTWAEITGDLVLFRADGDVPFATATLPDGAAQHMAIRSEQFADLLRLRFLERTGKSPSKAVLSREAETLAAVARLRGDYHEVSVRVARGPDACIYIDRGPGTTNFVRISAEGWDLVQETPCRFWRPDGMRVLPEPVVGSIDALRPLVNVRNDSQFQLLVGYLVDFFRAAPPHFVLILQGLQGTGKSSAAKVLSRILHPADLDLRQPPKCAQDLLIGAKSAPVLAYDNLTSIPDWLSDALCRLATRTGAGVRKLYTEFDEARIRAGCPTILTGIGYLAERDDLRERSIVLDLAEVTGRRTDAEFWADFEAALPRILGALYTAVSGALTGQANLPAADLPRMADGAVWISAAEEKLGWEPGSYLRAHRENQEDAQEQILEFDPIAPFVRQLADEHGTWAGTAAELLRALQAMRPREERSDPLWPRNAGHVSKGLDRIIPALDTVGVRVDRWREPGKERTRMIAISVDDFRSLDEAKRRRAGMPVQDNRRGRGRPATPVGREPSRSLGKVLSDLLRRRST